MALRDPKDVACDVHGWLPLHPSERKRGTTISGEDIVRADRAAVIAEAKRVVHGVHSFGDIPEDCECTYCDALDAILSEKG